MWLTIKRKGQENERITHVRSTSVYVERNDSDNFIIIYPLDLDKPTQTILISELEYVWSYEGNEPTPLNRK